MESDRGASAVRAAGNHVYIIEKWIDLAAVGGRKSRFVMGDGHEFGHKNASSENKNQIRQVRQGFSGGVALVAEYYSQKAKRKLSRILTKIEFFKVTITTKSEFKSDYSTQQTAIYF